MGRNKALAWRMAWMLALGLGLACPAAAVTLQPDGSPTAGDANLRLWLDATVAGSLFQDTGGTTPVADGSAVALWQDQSGNTFHVSQGNAGNRPSYTAAIGSLAGQPAVHFTGGAGGDALSRANNIGVSGNGDRTVITVWQNTAFTGQNYQHTFHMGDATANEAYGHSTARAWGAGTPIGNHYWAGGFDSTARASLNPTYAISTWDGDGGTAGNGLDSWYVNGNPSGASDRAPLATGTDQLHVGSRLNPFTEGFTGHLAEVIVYDTAVTPAERLQLEGYLNSKYGLQQAQVLPNGTPVRGDPHLKAWYRADAGVNTTGTSVTSWEDQSTATLDPSRTLTAPAGNEPTLVSSESTLAGRPVVSFDGSDYLAGALGSSPVTGNSDRTIFVVVTNKGTAPVGGKDHVLHFGDASTNQAYGVLLEAGGPNIGNHYWGTGFFPGTEASTADPTALTFVYDGAGVGGLTGLDAFFFNGAAAGTIDLLVQNPSSGGALNTGPDQFTVGSRINPFTEQLRGDIAEILIYDAKLPQDQIDLIHGYLAYKYGVRIEGAVLVPEPTSLGLVGLGLAALVRRRRRRRADTSA